MSFNYDDFLKKQTNKYLSHQNEEQTLTLPIIGFGGFQPKYRGNVYSHPAVKNLLETNNKHKVSRELSSTKKEQSCSRINSRSSNNCSTRKAQSNKYFTHIKPNCNPRGNVHTTYGSSFFYEWPGSSGKNISSSLYDERKKALVEERKYDRKEGIIYRKYGCIVPKYNGYIPGMKFRHGFSFGALTVNPLMKDTCALENVF